MLHTEKVDSIGFRILQCKWLMHMVLIDEYQFVLFAPRRRHACTFSVVWILRSLY